MKQMTWILLLLALVLACAGAPWLIQRGTGPVRQNDLLESRIYAYRDWQSVGIHVVSGDIIHVRARGQWLYTPEEYHGPEGHRTYPAPDTYPIGGSNVPGGILLARIGEDGDPLIGGRGRAVVANRGGILSFRINDEILSDNEGYVAV